MIILIRSWGYARQARLQLEVWGAAAPQLQRHAAGSSSPASPDLKMPLSGRLAKGFGAISPTKPYTFLWFGDIHDHKPCNFIGFRLVGWLKGLPWGLGRPKSVQVRAGRISAGF